MKNERGYTAVEVAMALAILGVGAAGAMTLQKIALLGNVEARIQDGARQVGATWASRLEVDALVWNDPMGLPDIGETRWLSASIPKGAFEPLAASEWMVAPEVPGWGAPTADIHGVDVYSAEPTERGFFCTHMRLSRVVDQAGIGMPVPRKTAVLADIRVVWRKDLSPMTECRSTPPAQIEAIDDRYAFHRLPPILILQKEASF